MDLRILITIMLFFIIIILFLPSKFNNIYTNDKYECGENKRLYPEGHISGDYLGLNKYNMDELTKKFNVNSTDLINKYIDDRK